MKELNLRLISSLVLLVIGFIMIISNDFVFLLISQSIYFLCLWEYLRLVKFKTTNYDLDYINPNFLLTRTKINYKNFILIIFLLISNIFFYFDFIFTSFFILGICISFFKKFNKDYLFFFGLLYILIPFYFLIYLRTLPDFHIYITFIIFFSFLVDAFAYFFGKKIGGLKLAPSISPNKTISGFIGGIIMPTVICLFLFNKNNLFYDIILNSLLFSITVQIGDLIESKLKRVCGVKDCSNIIPGHGGLLDRLDGILLFLILISLFQILDYNLFFIS